MKEQLENLQKKDNNFEYFDVDDVVSIKFGVIELMEKVEKEGYETLVFLDKSARPLSRIFRYSWKKILGERKMPEIKFVNPQKEITEEDKELFSKLYQGHVKGKVCLVDELSFSGDSYDKVRDFLSGLPGYEGGQVDDFDVMSIWPKWQRDSGKLTGVNDKTEKEISDARTKLDSEEKFFEHSRKNYAEASNFIAKPNVTEDSKILKNECELLSNEIARDYNVIREIIIEHEHETEKGVISKKVLEKLDKMQLEPTIQNFGGYNFTVVKSEALNNNLSKLNLNDLLNVYFYLRAYKLFLTSDTDEYGGILKKPHGLKHRDMNAVLESFCKEIEKRLTRV